LEFLLGSLSRVGVKKSYDIIKDFFDAVK
jgi:hypothetical protein